MTDLLFSLNGTVPLFLIMILGYLLKRTGFLTDEFVAVANKLLFKVTIPVLLFHDLVQVDVRVDFDGRYLLFCAVSTFLSIAVTWILARLFVRRRELVGEFVQGCYRSSAAILGAAFIQNIYGDSSMSGLMILGAVPLYNVFAVVILILEAPECDRGVGLWKSVSSSLRGIATNPIILGILAGLLASLVRLPIPTMVDKGLSGVAGLTTPLALIVIGAGFKGKDAVGHIGLSSVAAAVKLIVLPAVFLPVAVMMGFTDQKLIALIVMLGSITTPASYIMAKNMGHDGSLTASICVLTTFFSAFTLTFWIYLFHTLGYLS